MRIVALASCSWDYYQRLTPLCRHLARRGVEVVFVEPLVYRGARAPHLVPKGKIRVPPGVTVIQRATRLRRGPLLALRENLYTLRQVLRWKPDAVILCDASFTLLPALVLRPTRTKVILDYIDDWPEWSQVKWEKWMLRHVLIPVVARLADLCTVTAQLLGEDIRPFARQVVWIPNGAPDRPPELTDDDFRTGNGVIFVGGLAERIDVDWIVALARALPEIPVTILGAGPKQDTLSEAASQVPNLRVPGPVSHEAALDAIRHAAVCIIPYIPSRLTDRCFPIKLAEYWAFGKAVVATPCQEMERVGKGIVQFAATGGAAAAICSNLVRNPSGRSGIGRAGYALAVERFNYEVLTPQFLQALDPEGGHGTQGRGDLDGSNE